VALLEPGGTDAVPGFGPGQAREWLLNARLHLAPLVLRPFLDAYHVVADRLAAWDADEELDEERLLRECLEVGQQWALQRRLASAESVSLELFKPAVKLARHRGLLDAADPQVGQRREDLLAEVRDAVRRVNVIADLARPAYDGADLNGAGNMTALARRGPLDQSLSLAGALENSLKGLGS
jgi:glycerol-3-phosphate O-acyltransferase